MAFFIERYRQLTTPESDCLSRAEEAVNNARERQSLPLDESMSLNSTVVKSPTLEKIKCVFVIRY